MEVECHVCCRPVAAVVTVSRKAGSSFWSYLYHKNVREALLPSSDEAGSVVEGGGAPSSVPTLTFTFSFGGGGPSNQNRAAAAGIQICEDCQREVNHLETLHQQWESCKKLIAAQVQRIDEGRGVSRTNKKRDALWSQEVSLAGMSVGEDNISQVLQCIGTLCKGLNTNHPSKDSPREGDHLPVRTPIPVPVTPGGAETGPSEPSIPNGEGAGETPEWDAREDFSSCVVKLDPEANEEFMEEEEDPLAGEDIKPGPFLLSPDPGNLNTPKSSRETAPERGVPSKPKDPKVPCSVCGKWMTANSLTLHMKGHTGEAPYCCEFCGKNFVRNDHLVVHRRKHTKEKPFTCEVCGKAFTQSSSVKLHQRKIHGFSNQERQGEGQPLNCRSLDELN